MSSGRKPIRISFKYNVDTGEIEEFIIDDNAVLESEDYHVKMARAVASRLGRNPRITDAGPVRLSGGSAAVHTDSEKKPEEKPDTDTR